MKGITVILYERRQVGVDSLNNAIYEELPPVAVDNVLVGQPSTDDVISSLNLYAKSLDYVLGIPKGDTHEWENCEVEFFGKRFRSFGNVIEGIEANIPGPWHKQVKVQRYG